MRPPALDSPKPRAHEAARNHQGPARERRAPLERRLGAHLRERDLGHHRVLGERRGAHEMTHRLAATREARGAVGRKGDPGYFAVGGAG